ncbi:TPA: hypothetical protein EYN98_27345 [Candidatus Poribacteria bacterium]|nr:hypothetical protein [Candidatus Poribacteria bacterium]
MAYAEILIYSSAGRIVRTLPDGHQSASWHDDEIQSAYRSERDNYDDMVANDMYFCTLSADQFTATRKETFVR